MTRSWFVAACLSCLAVSLSLPAQKTTDQSVVVARPMPIVFEPADPVAKTDPVLSGSAGDLMIGFAPGAIIVQTPGSSASDRLTISFEGAQSASPSGDGLEKSQSNYLIGNDPARWRTHVPNYRQVRYRGLYQGVDAVFYGNGPQLEHDFVVEPGADYKQIRMRFSGATELSSSVDGSLRIGLRAGSMEMHAPVIYQESSGKRHRVDGSFRILANEEVGFDVGDYDHRAPLVIDPVLSFETYLSTKGYVASLIATDAAGNSYVSGYASSGYPVTPGAFQSCGACSSGLTFITKLSPDGTQLIYSTVLGGNSFAQPTGIGVDANGNVLVAGWTGATDFPTKNGQAIAPPNNAYMGFLVSLSPDGSSLNYGTMLGSIPTASPAAMTYASALAVDAAGNAYVTGETGNNFYISPGALNQGGGGSFGSQFNIYLVKFNPAGTLLYSAVLGTADPQTGGGGPIGSSAIAVDANGNAYVAGQAGSLWPTTSGAYHMQISDSVGYASPFLTKVAPDAKSLVYSTFLDKAYVLTGLAVLSNGNAFVTVNNADISYPTTANAYEQYAGNSNGSFLSELNASGSALVYSTGVCNVTCLVNGLTIDRDGNIWLAEQPEQADFPLALPLQGTFPTVSGGFNEPGAAVSEFDPTGQTLKFASFLGGESIGYASSVAVDPNRKVHVSGATNYYLYTTPNAYLGSVPAPAQGVELSTFAFVALIDPTVEAPALCAKPNDVVRFGSVPIHTSKDSSLTVTNCGSLPLTISDIKTDSTLFSIPSAQNECTQSLGVGQSCTLGLRYQPAAAANDRSILTISTNASMPGLLALEGTGTVSPVLSFSPSSLTFGPQVAGTSSSPQTITISNIGTGQLVNPQMSISAPGPVSFTLTTTCGLTLDIGASCTASIVFSPAATGTINATLTVFANGYISSPVTLTGSAPQIPFSIGKQPSGSTTATVAAGSSASYALQVAPAGGYSGTVTLSCTGVPANGSCGFSPGSLALANGTPSSFTLVIATQASQSASLLPMIRSGAPLLCALMLLPFGACRKWRAVLCAICLSLLAAALLLISGCSGGSSGPGSGSQPKTVAKGTYTISVVANDGKASQTQSVTLIVN